MIINIAACPTKSWDRSLLSWTFKACFMAKTKDAPMFYSNYHSRVESLTPTVITMLFQWYVWSDTRITQSLNKLDLSSRLGDWHGLINKSNSQSSFSWKERKLLCSYRWFSPSTTQSLIWVYLNKLPDESMTRLFGFCLKSTTVKGPPLQMEKLGKNCKSRTRFFIFSFWVIQE